MSPDARQIIADALRENTNDGAPGTMADAALAALSEAGIKCVRLERVGHVIERREQMIGALIPHELVIGPGEDLWRILSDPMSGETE